MEIIIFIFAVIVYICILRDEKRMNDEMQKNPPVKYIIEASPKKDS